MAENDAVIIDDDNLIILEVKAGAFTYTSPAYDFEAFRVSICNLMEKPAIQGQYFLDELNKQKILTLYNRQHKKICNLDISNFRNIIICCCSLDNFTAFSTKQNILKDLGFKESQYPAWTISLDDLRIYADLIESPAQFIHFLKQRIKAIKSQLSINDEIEHLALYFKYNCYVDVFENIKSYKVTIAPHKEDIDTYYHNKLIKDEKNLLIKPCQNISYRVKEILNTLDRQHKTGYTKMARYLLDLGQERQELENLIERALLRQKEACHLMPIHRPCETPVSLILYQDDMMYENFHNIIKQIYANMVIVNADECDCLQLDYDKDNKLYNIDWRHLKLSGLSENDKIEVNQYANWLKLNRLKMYIKNNHIEKIGRNEQCPCGSGKKYKYCCGPSFL